MKLFKNILPLIFVAFIGLVLFSCQKGGEPVPYGGNDSVSDVYDEVSSENQRGDQTGDTGSTGGEHGANGGNDGGGNSGGDDNVIGGDDNEDDDDVDEGFNFGETPKNGDGDPIGNGGI